MEPPKLMGVCGPSIMWDVCEGQLTSAGVRLISAVALPAPPQVHDMLKTDALGSRMPQRNNCNRHYINQQYEIFKAASGVTHMKLIDFCFLFAS